MRFVWWALASASLAVLAGCEERPPPPVSVDAHRPDASAERSDGGDADGGIEDADAGGEPEDGGMPDGTVADAGPSTGPIIRCLAPAHGGMITAAAGDRLRIVGIVADRDGVESLLANGSAVAVDELGVFEVTLTARYGMNHLELVASDGTGAESRELCSYLVASGWVASGNPIPDALTTALTASGLDDGVDDDAIGSIDDVIRLVLAGRGSARGMLENDLDARFAEPSFQFRNGTCDLLEGGECLVESTFTYMPGSAEVEGPSPTTTDVASGGLRFAARAAVLTVRGRVRGVERVTRPGFDTTFEGPAVIMIPDLRFDATVRLSLSSGSVRAVFDAVSALAHGTIAVDATLDDPRVEGAVERGMAADLNALSNTHVRDAIRGFLVEHLAAVIGAIVGSADVRTPPGALPIELLGGDARPDSLTFGATLEDIEATPTGLAVRASTTYLGSTVLTVPTLGAAVASDVASVPVASTRPLVHRISERVLNAVAHELWRAGALQTSVSGATIMAPAGVTVPPAILTPDGTIAPSEAPVPERITTDALLPPVVLVASSGEGPRVRVMLGAIDLRAEGTDGLFAEGPLTIRLAATVEFVAGADAIGADPVFIGAEAGGGVRISELAFRTDRPLSGDARVQAHHLVAVVAWSIAQFVLNRGSPSLPLISFRIPTDFTRYGLPGGQILGTSSPRVTMVTRQLEVAGDFGPVP